MAYNGYLIRVGGYTIPQKYIQAESYKVTLNTMDLDTYTDANGLLHRNALSTVTPKVEFNTIPALSNFDIQDLLGNIRNNYTNVAEKRVRANVYIPILDRYVTQDMYLVDPTMEVYYADGAKIWYKPFRLAFIGYGGEA